MKKVLALIVCLCACLVVSRISIAVGQCELEVTNGDGSDPCVVINRVGFKDGGEWIIDEDECDEVQGKIESTGGVLADKGELGIVGNGRIDDATSYIYFECNDQEEAKDCTIRFIAGKMNDDKGYCDIGEFDGYERTQVVMFQMEYVVTRALHEHKGPAAHVDQIENHFPTFISQPIVHEVGFNQQIIYSDVRAYWDGFDDDEECLGHDCDDDSQDADDIWEERLVNEAGDWDGIEVLEPDNFDDHRDVTLLDAPGVNGVRAEGTVPIIVGGLSDAEYAITVRGPMFSLPGARVPRLVIRGWDVQLFSGAGLIKTEGHVEIVFARSIIDFHTSAAGVFNFSKGTIVNFEDGLTVNMLGATKVPIVFGGPAAGSGIMEVIGQAIGATVDSGSNGGPYLPPLSSGLKITYTTLGEYTARPLSVDGDSGSEMTLECTVGNGCQGIMEEIGEFLVFEMDDGTKEFRISHQSYPLNVSLNSGELVGNRFSIYAASGEHNGSRIVFGLELKDGVAAVAAIGGPKHIPPKALDDVPDANLDEGNDDFEYGEDGDEGGEPVDCPEGEYWNHQYDDCVPLGQKKVTVADSGDSSEEEGGFEEGGADVGTGYDYYTKGGLEVEGGYVASDDGSEGPDDDDSDAPTGFAASGGCSLMAANMSVGLINMFFPLLSLAFFVIRKVGR